MSQMDLFTPLLQTTDTRKKLAIGTDIINYLGLPSNSIECDDIGMFIDGLVPWLQSSNFKVRKIYDKDTVLQRRASSRARDGFVLFCFASRWVLQKALVLGMDLLKLIGMVL